MRNFYYFSMTLIFLGMIGCQQDDSVEYDLENLTDSSSRTTLSNQTIITQDGNQFTGGDNQASNWGEGLDKLNDGNINTKHYVNNGEVNFTYSVNTPLVPNQYNIVSGNDPSVDRDPKEWVVYGYHNNTWEIIDQQFNQSFSKRREKKEFTLDVSKAYTAYYFSFKTHTNSFELTEIEVIASSDEGPDTEDSFTFNYSNYNQYVFDYENYNSQGADIVRNTYTINRIKELLNDKAGEIANLLYYNSNDISNRLKLNKFIISENDGVAWSIGNGGAWNESGSVIWISEIFIQKKYNSLSYNDFFKEIDGVIIHEMAHTLSIGHNNGNRDSSQYVEAIADYCRIKLGYRSSDPSSNVYKPVATSSINNANAYNISWFLLYLEKYKDTGATKKIVKYYNANPNFTWNAAMNHIGLDLSTTWNQYVSYIQNGGNL